MLQEESRPSNATENIIHLINSTKSISRSIHEMVHTCNTTEDFFDRLAGLLKVFWGDKTPDGFNIDEAVWLHVAVETMPPECLLPLFNNSVAKLEGKELEEIKKHETEESN
tara:strand:- start:55 stop:387 length:333 start_codon:yes stop_codon:yes gene_type:complete